MNFLRSLFGSSRLPPAPRAELVDDYLRNTACVHPHAAAIGRIGDTIDFAELDARANQIANGLRAEGNEGDRIALIGRNSREMAELLLGCIRARLIALPLNWRLSAPELAYILDHAAPRHIFTDREFAETVGQANAVLGADVQLIDDAGPGEYPRWRARQSAAPVPGRGQSSDVVLQMYTSGTTGLPKGVQITNAGAIASTDAFSQGALELGPGDVIYAPAPVFHITGIGPLMRCVQTGARLILPPRFEADQAVRDMAAEGVTYTTLAPAMIQACLDSPELEHCNLRRLRLIVYGGSPISQPLLDLARARIGCRFAQGYGLTESSGAVSLLTPEDHAPARRKLASCGRAARGVEVAVAAPDGRRLPPGETGEILVRGEVIMKGYASDPEATRQAIVDGWLHTGDAGYLDDEGYLFIRDRVKDMIVSGGENVYPVEVENALLAHPDVADAAVIGVPDVQWGEAVLAFVVPAPGSAPDAASLVTHCHGRIAGYKCPKQIRFADAIPRNAAGKILRRELRAPFWEGRERLVG